MRPSVASPTGTLIGAPVSITSTPRADAVGRVHRDGAHAVVAQVLLDFGDQLDRRASLALGDDDLQRGVDLGQPISEDGVDDDPLDLDDRADVAGAPVCVWSSAMRLLNSRF